MDKSDSPIAGFSTLNNPLEKLLSGQFKGNTNIPNLLVNRGCMLDRSRPVMGKDLNPLAESLGLDNIIDKTWLYGINLNIWYEYTKPDNKIAARKKKHKAIRTERAPDKPVDLTTALFCRFLDAYPDSLAAVKLKTPDIVLLSKAFDTGLGKNYRLAELMGRNKSALYRWTHDKNTMSQIICRLASVLLHWLNVNESIIPDTPPATPYEKRLLSNLSEKVKIWEALYLFETEQRDQEENN